MSVEPDRMFAVAEKGNQASRRLWWVPAGHRPSVGEAVERLERLQQH